MRFSIIFLLYFIVHDCKSDQSVLSNVIQSLLQTNEADSEQVIPGLFSSALKKLSSCERLNASLDEFITRTCDLIQNNEDFDVVSIPKQDLHFLLVHSHLDNGILRGLRSVSRTGNCFVNYEAKLLLLVTKFKLSRVEVEYDVRLKFIYTGPIHRMKFAANELYVETAVLVDATNISVTLDRIVLPNAKKLEAQVEHPGPLGYIFNVISKVILFIFKKPILKLIEYILEDSIQDVFYHLPYFNRTTPITPSPACQVSIYVEN